MRAASERPVGTAVLVRSHLAGCLLILAGCTGQGVGGSLLSPPGSGNRNVISYRAVAVNGIMNCVLVNAGSAMCWGRGTLGDGRTTESVTAVRVAGAVTYEALSVGGFSACGVSSNGVASCWGRNLRGANGDGTTEDSDIPVGVATGERFTDIDTSSGHTCAVNVDHEAFCWGGNKARQLGIASSDSVSLVPEPVLGGHAFSEVHAGFQSTCGLTTGGEALCWGENWGPTPEPVPTSLRFASMSFDSRTACALTAEGEAHCWGSNYSGAFGNGELDEGGFERYDPVPVAVATDLRFSKISTTGSHTCAIERDAEAAYCWGSDLSGQIGDGTLPGGVDDEHKLFPTRVKLSRRFTDIGVGGGSSCGITSGNEAHCWGSRTGNPLTPVADIPVRVGG